MEITLLALLVLRFSPSSKGWAPFARLSRDQMDLNASMNATMQERFNVSGAMLASSSASGGRGGRFSAKAGAVR